MITVCVEERYDIPEKGNSKMSITKEECGLAHHRHGC
jgi:hypothetical protein